MLGLQQGMAAAEHRVHRKGIGQPGRSTITCTQLCRPSQPHRLLLWCQHIVAHTHLVHVQVQE